MSQLDLPAQLSVLRAEIDRIDTALHDLLMQRAAVVERVAGLGRLGKIPFRPGREAAIIRRLLDRHHGRLPAQAVVRIWREVIAAHIAIEQRILIAVCETTPDAQMTQAAREQFGALTATRAVASPREALALVADGTATAAVLPMPGPLGPAWWTAIAEPEGALHVVARLPCWGRPRAEGTPAVAALVVAAAAPDASGADRTLIACDLPQAAALPAGAVLLGWHPERAGRALLDLDGFDPPTAGLAQAVRLGSYAVPFEAAS